MITPRECLVRVKYLLNPFLGFRRYFAVDYNRLFVVQYVRKGKIA